MNCDQVLSSCVGSPKGEKLALRLSFEFLVSSFFRDQGQGKSTQACGWPNETQVERREKICFDMSCEPKNLLEL